MSYLRIALKRLFLTLLPFLAITALTIVISSGIHTNESGFITITPEPQLSSSTTTTTTTTSTSPSGLTILP